jgi:Mat/Ecp fimbriae outer membrane usher protein
MAFISTALGQSPVLAQTSVDPPQPVVLEVEDPEGFDDLIEARESALNLYVDGQSVGTVPVLIAPGSIRFVDPAALIPRLPALRDPAGVIAALKAPMPSHAGLSCSPAPVTGCGRLNPQVVGVILSRDMGRLDLFLAGDVRGQSRQHLPDPPKGPPTLAGAIALQYTLSSRQIGFTLQPRAVIGFGRSHIAVDATFSDRQSSLDRGYFRHNGSGTAFSAGLLSATPFSFVYFDRLVGLSFGSSIDTRIERGSMADTPILIDIPLQGRVEIRRDGVLIDTQRVAPGRAEIDTAALPSGAYPLTLKIIDATGERTETRFFVRAAGLPGYGETQYFIDAGYNTAFRGQSTDFLPSLLSPTIRMGINRRAGPQLGVLARAEITQKRRLAELGATYLNANWRLTATLGLTDNQDYAAAINASGNLKRINWSLDARLIHDRSIVTVNRDPEQGLGRSYQQLSAHGGWSGKTVSLSTALIWRRDPPGRSSYTFLPNARWTIFQGQGRRWELETSGSYNRDSWSLRAGLRASLYSGRVSTSFSAGTEGRQSNAATSFSPFGSADWSRSQETGLGPLQLRAGASQQGERTSGRLGANLTTTYLQASAEAQIEQRLSSSSVFGRLETSFGLAGGKLAFGSGGFTGSGIAVEAPDAGKDATFSVRAFGTNARPIRGNRAVFVSTPPFSQGDIGINTLGGATNFDSRNERAIFYPGTVKRLVRGSTQVIIIYAQLTDEAGAYIVNASVGSQSGVSETDGQGRVQIEVSSGAVLDVQRDDGTRCAVKVPALSKEAMFVSLGNLVCFQTGT